MYVSLVSTYITKKKGPICTQIGFSVLCQSSSQIQHGNVFLAFLVINVFDLVLVLESGDLAIALLFDRLDDHSNSGDFSLSGNKGDLIVGLKLFLSLCYSCVDINECLSFDVDKFNLWH